MTLTSGTRLGPYEILAPVGAGGMGEVYRAKDTRLDRVVAVKVLPSHLSQNQQFRQRFEREAKTISSLSHPHICALYDIGHQTGMDYLVMEFLEGENLAHRLDKGALPTEQVLQLGIQVAEALDKAHKQGIVHRDLKPGNIMLTKSGAKLLDFGLAKYQQLGVDDSTATNLPTQGKPLTEEGTLLGTVQYMAPEQLEGKEVDGRTDIFALGEILYEMSTGKRTFTGTSKAKLMSAILSSEPPAISTIQPLAPPALDHVVTKCIAKDPDDRWQSARDVAGELRWISELTSQSKMAAPVLRRRINRERLAWSIGTLLLASLATYLYVARMPSEQKLLRVSIVPEEDTRIAGQLAISPDGQNVAFVAKTLKGEIALWVRSLDSSNARKLPGTTGATYPFWSPDSRVVGFFAEGKLKKIDMMEGPPQTVCDAPIGRGGTWNKEGTILFSPNFTSNILQRISAAGGTPAPANAPISNSTNVHPHFLPDGKHFLYQVSGGTQKELNGTYVGSLDSREARRILPDVARVEYADPGYVLFVREKNLMGQRFDAKRLELTGEAFPIAENISFDGAYHSFSVSRTGVLCFSNVDLINTQLVWMDRAGKQIANVGEPGQLVEPTFSPDEKKVVIGQVDRTTNRVNLWIVDPTRQTFSRFTNEPTSNNYCSLWSPDGGRIVYSSTGRDTFDLFERVVGGTSDRRLVVTSGTAKFADDWTRDGRYIMYETDDPKTKYDLWYLPLFGDRKPKPYLQSEFNEAHARFSPDGRWVAYGSDEIGRTEIYVRPFPDAARGKWQVSTGGGDQPYWRGDGKELYYLAPDGNLMAVEVKTGDTFEPGVPASLFQTNVIPQGLVGSDRNQYVVTSDGQRFLVNSSPAQALFAPITVVFNWTAMLKK